MIVPNQNILKTFQNQAGLIFHKILHNNNTSKNLENLRDTLLPKLISGDLKVSDAESLIEEESI